MLAVASPVNVFPFWSRTLIFTDALFADALVTEAFNTLDESIAIFATDAGATTVIVKSWLAVPEVTLIWAAPSAIGVSVPVLASTIKIDGSNDSYETSVPFVATILSPYWFEYCANSLSPVAFFAIVVVAVFGQAESVAPVSAAAPFTNVKLSV